MYRLILVFVLIVATLTLSRPVQSAPVAPDQAPTITASLVSSPATVYAGSNPIVTLTITSTVETAVKANIVIPKYLPVWKVQPKGACNYIAPAAAPSNSVRCTLDLQANVPTTVTFEAIMPETIAPGSAVPLRADVTVGQEIATSETKITVVARNVYLALVLR